MTVATKAYQGDSDQRRAQDLAKNAAGFKPGLHYELFKGWSNSVFFRFIISWSKRASRLLRQW